jgi:outer membrane lipoprotein-sorting protein
MREAFMTWPRPSRSFLATLLLATLAGGVHHASAAGAAPAASDASLALDDLLAHFRTIAGLSARFREEKHIALLAAPLVSEGTVHYAPPGRLARHTLVPSASSVVLDGTTLRFGDGTSSYAIDTSTSPVVRAFVDSFLAVLAGDRGRLDRNFLVEFRNTPAPAGKLDRSWEIVLTPRDPSLTRIIREIRLAGSGVVVEKIRIREASGDESVTTFSEVDPARTYSPAEADRVFRLAGA